MYAVHKTLATPSAVSQAVTARFTGCPGTGTGTGTGSGDHDLILVLGTTALQVWHHNNEQLSFFAQWALYGQVAAIHPIPFASCPTQDALLVAFTDAKFAILEYDSGRHQLVSRSLHSFEYDQSLRTGSLLTPLPPILTVDPSATCALALIFRDHWAVLPLGPSTGAAAPSFVVRPSALPAAIHDIVDLVFVPGYLQPTLAVLHQADTRPTWGATLDLRKDTMRVAVVSLDLRTRTQHATLFATPNLPASSFALAAVPAPLAGILVLTANGLIYLSQQAPNGVGACVNAFPLGASTAATAVKETEFKYTFDHSHLGLSLDAAAVAGMHPLPRGTGVRVLLALPSGELWACDLLRAVGGLAATARGGMHDIRFARLFTTAPVAAIVPLQLGRLWFVASANGPSLLVAVDQALATPALVGGTRTRLASEFGGDDVLDAEVAQATGSGKRTTKIVKRRRIGEVSAELMGGGAELVRMTVEEAVDNQQRFTKSVQPPSVTDRLVKVGDRVGAFKVVDAITGLGGLKEAVFCQTNGQNMIFALAGHATGAHFVLLAQSLRPRLVDKFKVFAGARKLWSLQPSPTTPHSLLVMTGGGGGGGASTDQRTLVFRTGKELIQVQDTAFVTSARSLYVGMLCGGTRMVQVLDHAVILMDADGCFLDRVDLEAASGGGNAAKKPAVAVAAAASGGAGKYVVVLSPALALRVYAVAGDKRDKLALVHEEEGVAFASVVTDNTGALVTRDELRTWLGEEMGARVGNRENDEGQGSGMPTDEVPVVMDDMDLDDFERDLYATVEPTPAANGVGNPSAKATAATTNGLGHDAPLAPTPRGPLQPTHREVLVIIRAGTGSVHMMDLDQAGTVTELFACTRVHSQPMSFMDGYDEEQVEGGPTPVAVQRSPAGLVQAHIMTVGSRPEDTYLLLVTKDATLLVYQARLADSRSPSSDGSRLAVVWTKLALDPTLLVHAHNLSAKRPGTGGAPPPAWLSLHPFTNVNGHAGVFAIRGGGGMPRQSFWLLRSRHGALHVVPSGAPISASEADKAKSASKPNSVGDFGHHAPLTATSFATFDNVNCPQGFVFMTGSGELVLAQLDPLMDVSVGMPHRTVHTGITATAASYDDESQTIAVASCWDVPYDMIVEVPDQTEHNKPTGIDPFQLQPDMLNRTVRQGFYAPTIKRYRIELISTDNWRTGDTLTLDPFEQVTAIYHMPLETKSSQSGRKPFLIVATTFIHGEDVAAHGRIYVYDTVNVVPEPGRPETGKRLKLQYVEEIKAPVTALGQVEGHLAVGQGNKIICYDMDEDDQGERVLMGMAFHHTTMMVSHLVSLKQFLAIGDALQSVHLFVMQADPVKLIPLGVDQHQMSVCALEGMVRGDQAAFVAADDVGGVHMMAYAPHNIQTHGGVKLLRRGDFFVGAPVSKMLRYRLGASAAATGQADTPIAVNGMPGDTVDNGLCNLFVCRDGSIGLLVPTSEVMYKRLLLLYNRLADHIPTVAGLHPKAHRHQSLVQSRLFSNNQATMLDLNLVVDLLHRPIAEQHAHIKTIGTSVGRVRGDLRGLQQAWTLL
ncbi:CPSF A subunit region-domain-containing protein [Catenaria anguillulae PL171]|uniref:CPSF A subunit region-domain-containing protein n=1 Tax=Catenaria anguillulae PL171 TaxID=765915 RepID=A0A1Y2I2K8_9FUNG|nr:CPSF A subunit region-domain-containing protein [Catenaria anguillulae PL171]